MKRNVPALCPCVCCVGADKAISPELPHSPAKLVETRCTRETITRSAGHRNTHLSYPNNKIPDMRNHRFLSLCASGLAILLSATAAPLPAQEGHWEITQLPIANAYHPSINNTGEIVWFLNSDGGVFSSTRGKLADAGINPHLANSGEVAYAGWFGGPAWDLVSTTRGRLTQGPSSMSTSQISMSIPKARPSMSPKTRTISPRSSPPSGIKLPSRPPIITTPASMTSEKSPGINTSRESVL